MKPNWSQNVKRGFASSLICTLEKLTIKSKDGLRIEWEILLFPVKKQRIFKGDEYDVCNASAKSNKESRTESKEEEEKKENERTTKRRTKVCG